MKIVLYNDNDGVNSDSFFQPPEQILTLKCLMKPDLKVDNSAICWPVVVGNALHLQSSV